MSELRELQLLELDILKEFIEVCKKLNIKYYLVGGTLIGCIRHGGFIPWDDDIDVAMTREDYEIFLKEGQKLLPSELFIQTFETDKEYTQNFAKIRNSNTTFIETSTKNQNINHGVYIDIFPFDNCVNSKLLQRYLNIRKNVYDIQIEKNYYLENNVKKSVKYKILKCISDLFYGRKSLKEIQVKKEKMFKKYNNMITDYYISYSGIYGRKEIYPKSFFKDVVQKKFENIYVNVPIGFDAFLTKVYGNYMELPPLESRQTHHYCDKIDLKHSYTNYIEKGDEK